MSLAILLIVASALALVLILTATVSRTMQVSLKGDSGLQPIDVEAFRNLVDPAEDAYLRHHLTAAEFRTVRRERLRAVAAYVQVAGRNAALLIHIGQGALASTDTQTAEAARQLVNEALLVRRNATLVLMKIYMILAWPNSGLFAAPILHEYQQMSGAAMLLGRLQHPSVPVRISAPSVM
jgi:hypothetical protein